MKRKRYVQTRRCSVCGMRVKVLSGRKMKHCPTGKANNLTMGQRRRITDRRWKERAAARGLGR